MASDDILKFAWGSFFLGLFIAGILSLASGGIALLDNEAGQNEYETTNNLLSIRSQSATFSNFLDKIVNSAENPLAFDIVLGIVNVGLFILKIAEFLILTLVNYFTLSVWLTSTGAPGSIVGLLVMGWQFWTFYYLGTFIFKDRLKG